MVYQDPGAALNPTLTIGRQLIECFTLLGHKSDGGRRSSPRGAAAGADRRPRAGDGAATRTSCPAACSSAWSSPWRWPAIPSCSCSTSRPPASTPRSRRRCSTWSGAAQHETDAAILLIAHNLGVIRAMCDRVGVMYAGQIVEEGHARRGVRRPQAPVHRRSAALLPRHGVAQGASGRSPPSRAPCPLIGARSADVRVRRPLPAGRRRVPHRGAAPWSTSASGRYSGATTPTASRRSAEPAAERRRRPPSQRPRWCSRCTGVSKTFKQSGNDVPALVGVDLGWPTARPSGSWASRAPARSRWPRRCSASTPPTPAARSTLDGEAARRRRPPSAPPTTSGPCRWSSRTPTRRSTATGPCAAS